MDHLGHHPEEDKELNGSAGPSSRGRQGTENISWLIIQGTQGTEWISWAFIQRKTMLGTILESKFEGLHLKQNKIEHNL